MKTKPTPDNTFWCNYGNHLVTVPIGTIGAGYATFRNSTEKHCYECCAKVDRAYMIQDGKYTLYLTKCYHPETWPRAMAGETYGTYKVTNWPGTLTFYCGNPRKGRHNIAGTRYDVWFTGPDGYVWHGVQYGENTQVCHCQRTKEKA